MTKEELKQINTKLNWIQFGVSLILFNILVNQIANMF